MKRLSQISRRDEPGAAEESRPPDQQHELEHATTAGKSPESPRAEDEEVLLGGVESVEESAGAAGERRERRSSGSESHKEKVSPDQEETAWGAGGAEFMSSTRIEIGISGQRPQADALSHKSTWASAQRHSAAGQTL